MTTSIASSIRNDDIVEKAAMFSSNESHEEGGEIVGSDLKGEPSDVVGGGVVMTAISSDNSSASGPAAPSPPPPPPAAAHQDQHDDETSIADKDDDDDANNSGDNEEDQSLLLSQKRKRIHNAKSYQVSLSSASASKTNNSKAKSSSARGNQNGDESRGGEQHDSCGNDLNTTKNKKTSNNVDVEIGIRARLHAERQQALYDILMMGGDNKDGRSYDNSNVFYDGTTMPIMTKQQQALYSNMIIMSQQAKANSQDLPQGQQLTELQQDQLDQLGQSIMQLQQQRKQLFSSSAVAAPTDESPKMRKKKQKTGQQQQQQVEATRNGPDPSKLTIDEINVAETVYALASFANQGKSTATTAASPGAQPLKKREYQVPATINLATPADVDVGIEEADDDNRDLDESGLVNDDANPALKQHAPIGASHLMHRKKKSKGIPSKKSSSSTTSGSSTNNKKDDQYYEYVQTILYRHFMSSSRKISSQVTDQQAFEGFQCMISSEQKPELQQVVRSALILNKYNLAATAVSIVRYIQLRKTLSSTRQQQQA